MRKGVFLLGKMDREKVKQALRLGADGLFVGHKNLRRELCRELKERGIGVYAEIGIFAGEELWQKHPNARPVDKDGRPMGKADWYAGVCPNHPEVREEKLKEVEELVRSFNVDGIWLDFIRYPCHWEEVRSVKITEYCFCQNCLEKFEKEAKTPRGWPPPPELNVVLGNGLTRGGRKKKDSEWLRWKCGQITSFVAEVRNLINQSGKDIQLGMFAVPWSENDFNGAILRVIGQDFPSLAKYIDVFSPMVYHRMCGRPVQWIHETVVYMDKITGKPILPIIQTEDKPEKITKEEFAKALSLSLELPSSGVIVFFLEDLLKDDAKIDVVKEKIS